MSETTEDGVRDDTFATGHLRSDSHAAVRRSRSEGGVIDESKRPRAWPDVLYKHAVLLL
jgi:hypothetical protein